MCVCVCVCVCVCWLEEMDEKKAGYTLGFRIVVSKCSFHIKLNLKYTPVSYKIKFKYILLFPSSSFTELDSINLGCFWH